MCWYTQDLIVVTYLRHKKVDGTKCYVTASETQHTEGGVFSLHWFQLYMEVLQYHSSPYKFIQFSNFKLILNCAAGQIVGVNRVHTVFMLYDMCVVLAISLYVDSFKDILFNHRKLWN